MSNGEVRAVLGFLADPVDRTALGLSYALSDLTHAYNRLVLLDDLVKRLGRASVMAPGTLWPFATWRPGGWPAGALLDNEAISIAVRPADRLVLASAHIASPGGWDFIGRLNPLEVLRLAINDWHERRKDREWREAREARRLDLENQLKETELIGGLFELAEQAGASQEELRGLFDEFVGRPMLNLDHAADSQILGRASVRPLSAESARYAGSTPAGPPPDQHPRLAPGESRRSELDEPRRSAELPPQSDDDV